VGCKERVYTRSVLIGNPDEVDPACWASKPVPRAEPGKVGSVVLKDQR